MAVRGRPHLSLAFRQDGAQPCRIRRHIPGPGMASSEMDRPRPAGRVCRQGGVGGQMRDAGHIPFGG